MEITIIQPSFTAKSKKEEPVSPTNSPKTKFHALSCSIVLSTLSNKACAKYPTHFPFCSRASISVELRLVSLCYKFYSIKLLKINLIFFVANTIATGKLIFNQIFLSNWLGSTHSKLLGSETTLHLFRLRWLHDGLGEN